MNQRSGVSVRLSIANYETLVANAVRRALRLGESDVVPRVSDLGCAGRVDAGKVEIETLEEGREATSCRLPHGRRADRLQGPLPGRAARAVVVGLRRGTMVHAGDDLASNAYAEVLGRIPVLRGLGQALAGRETPAAVASATEFVLEGLHLTKRLNKDAAGARATYRAGGVGMTPGSITPGGTAPRSASSSTPTTSWPRSPTTCCTTGTSNQALRRMLQQGSGTARRAGGRAAGDAGAAAPAPARTSWSATTWAASYDDIAERLREVVDMERAGIDELEQEARQSGDERRQQITDEVAAERRMQLDLLPPDLAGQVRELQEYEWTSSEARERFDELLDQLRQELMQSYFNQMAGAHVGCLARAAAAHEGHVQRPEPAARDARAGRGHRPAPSTSSCSSSATSSPATRRRLDELLEQMAQQMAAMQNLLNSMTPEQRAQLQGLAEALLEDMDLRWQVDRLGANLRQAFPGAGWDRRAELQRPGPARLRRGGRAHEPARRHGPAGEPPAPGQSARAPWPMSTSSGPASSSATTPPGRSSVWPSWPSSWRRPV